MAPIHAVLETCVTGIAEQLTQPDVVLHEMYEKSGRGLSVQDQISKVWSPTSLAYGYPGISLLFSELSHRDDYYRPVAHTYLQLALKALEPSGTQGLYDGLTAVAFSLRGAQRSADEYQGTLARLETLIEKYAYRVLEFEQRRIEDSVTGTSFTAYDVTSGLTGVARYLLLPTVPRTGCLRDIISYLVSLTQNLTIQGTEVPGWWVAHASAVEVRHDLEHINFGLAHGAAGILSVLSLAWEAGERTAGHSEAIHKLVEWFSGTAVRDEYGVRWPATLTLAEYRDPRHVPPHTRPSWCYGSAGISHAIQLAGQALGVRHWSEFADQAIDATLDRLERHRDIREVGLCHGWGGLLHMVTSMNRKKPRPALAARTNSMRTAILESAQPGAAFTFRSIQSGNVKGLNIPGLLEGSSGVALALLASPTEPTVSGWDRALLLA